MDFTSRYSVTAFTLRRYITVLNNGDYSALVFISLPAGYRLTANS
jgi:hypothetical protein